MWRKISLITYAWRIYISAQNKRKKRDESQDFFFFVTFITIYFLWISFSHINLCYQQKNKIPLNQRGILKAYFINNKLFFWKFIGIMDIVNYFLLSTDFCLKKSYRRLIYFSKFNFEIIKFFKWTFEENMNSIFKSTCIGI